MCGILVVHKDNVDSFDLDIIAHRGPDHSSKIMSNDYIFGFVRLSIVDTSSNGHQPFINKHGISVTNGEIYNHKELMKQVDYEFVSKSDCEVLLPLLEKYSTNLFNMIDGEFATVMFDNKTNQLIAARDHLGIRPLFYGYDLNGNIAFCSEMKGLESMKDIRPFPPGHFYINGSFHKYKDVSLEPTAIFTFEESISEINRHLTAAVRKRIDCSDVPIGYLLSGGLDSSLVCSIAQEYSKQPIRTFAIGMDKDPIDLKYAKIVSDYIGTIHTEVIITKQDVIECLTKVIWHLETYDITTIRASIGMYLLCKYIKENTDIKVLLTGEVSDELFGYKYTDFAPDAKSFQEESLKRVRELHYYDVLRADRCIAGNSIEARVPFSDYDFMKSVISIDPKLKMNSTGCGKYLLRKAFENSYLPHDILWREKAAFSDAVGHSLVDALKEFAESSITDNEFLNHGYTDIIPPTKEALLYRKIYDGMYFLFFQGRMHNMIGYWMPNPLWVGKSVTDPSARYLSNYGKSGE